MINTKKIQFKINITYLINAELGQADTYISVLKINQTLVLFQSHAKTEESVFGMEKLIDANAHMDTAAGIALKNHVCIQSNKGQILMSQNYAWI